MENREPEVWKDIETPGGYYQISSWGRCRKLFYRELTKGRSGYAIVTCSENNKAFHLNVAHEVAKAFCPKLKNEKVVNHKDSDISNNYYKNLEWATQRENVSHSFIKSRNASNRYTGVYYQKKSRKYGVQISVKGTRYNIGSHQDEEVAAYVYLCALTIIGERNRYFKVRGVIIDNEKNITPQYVVDLIRQQNPNLVFNEEYLKKIFGAFKYKLHRDSKLNELSA
jgi:hypothetical protein